MDFTLLDIEKLLDSKLDSKLDSIEDIMKSISNSLNTVHLRLDSFESRFKNIEDLLEKIERHLTNIEKGKPTVITPNQESEIASVSNDDEVYDRDNDPIIKALLGNKKIKQNNSPEFIEMQKRKFEEAKEKVIKIFDKYKNSSSTT